MKSILSTSARDLETSRSFFRKAGFKEHISKNKILFNDGPICVELDESNTSRPSIKMYGEIREGLLENLKKFGAILEKDSFYLLTDPSGTWIYLMKEEVFPELHLPENSESIFGDYVGISIECVDIRKAINFYALLGFEKTMGSVDGGWVSMKNEHGDDISIMAALMCPHMFTNPSLTYFNHGNNLKNIAKIREVKIEISEEITIFNDQNIVDNVVLHEPGGIGFFIFND